MYSAHNEEKSVIVAERFIRILKNKIYEYMTSTLKTVYIDDIVKKYNNTYQITIKMKPVDVKSCKYIDSSKEMNDGDPKFKIGDLLEHQNIKAYLQKGYVPNWS